MRITVLKIIGYTVRSYYHISARVKYRENLRTRNLERLRNNRIDFLYMKVAISYKNPFPSSFQRGRERI